MTAIQNPVLDKIPQLKNAVVWDVKDQRVDYVGMFELYNWKGLGFNIGYNPPKAVLVALDYDMVNLKKMGVTTPLIDLIDIRPMVAYGYDRIDPSDMNDTREKVMVGASILNFRFY